MLCIAVLYSAFAYFLFSMSPDSFFFVTSPYRYKLEVGLPKAVVHEKTKVRFVLKSFNYSFV
jgi:hypothetical protein